MNPEPVGFLAGIRVCLCANYLPGPLAAYLLRCMGAEVIKVESPGFDLLRKFPPMFASGDQSMGAWFRSVNAGFKSIVIDFKRPGGGQLFREVLGECDILIDGNRPGRLSMVLGAEPTDLLPHLIHIPISAYGISGPKKESAGHDGNLLALAGNLSYTASGKYGQPAMFSAPVVDILSAHTAALCALAAWIGRSKGNQPRVVDVSMLHNAFFLNQLQFATYNLLNEMPKPDQAWMNGGLANYRIYMTSDNKPVFFGPIEEHLFALFAERIDRQDLVGMLYRDNDSLKAELERIFRNKSLQEWVILMDEVDCCFSPVNNLEEAMNDEQVQHLGLLQDVGDPVYGKMRLAGFPAGFGAGSIPPKVPDHAPIPGEHTEWVLKQLLSKPDSEIQSLMESGVVKS